MKCPKCGHEWQPRNAHAKELGARGGSKSKRKITPEQQAELQEARKRKKADSQAHNHD